MATTTKTAAKTAAAEAATETVEIAETMSFAAADWADKAKEQFETMMSSFTGNFDDLRSHGEGLAEEVQARVKANHDRAAKTNARLVEAAKEEMTNAVQFASDLGKAKTFADALTVQQTYWTKFFETRMEHAKEITETTVEAARETMTPVEMPFANMKAYEKFFPFSVKA